MDFLIISGQNGLLWFRPGFYWWVSFSIFFFPRGSWVKSLSPSVTPLAICPMKCWNKFNEPTCSLVLFQTPTNNRNHRLIIHFFPESTKIEGFERWNVTVALTGASMSSFTTPGSSSLLAEPVFWSFLVKETLIPMFESWDEMLLIKGRLKSGEKSWYEAYWLFA